MAEDSSITLNREDQSRGTIKVSNRVLEFIAGIAASQIKGVSKMHGSLANNVSELLGRSDHRRGVKLANEDDGLVVDVAVYLNYGVSVPKVAAEIQDKVKQQIALMTNLTVKEVNVHVQGVVPEKDNDNAIDPNDIFAASHDDDEEGNGEEK